MQYNAYNGNKLINFKSSKSLFTKLSFAPLKQLDFVERTSAEVPSRTNNGLWETGILSLFGKPSWQEFNK
jgi:hypothetical protein